MTADQVGGRKRAFIGVLLNLVLLPWGYYYLQQPRRFFIFLACTVFLSPLLAGLHLAAFHAGGAMFALTVLAGSSIAWQLFLIIDSLRAARLAPAQESWLARPTAYWLVPILLAGILLAQLPAGLLKRQFSNLHLVDGISNMRPTLRSGDYFYASAIFQRDRLQRGDVVLFTRPGPVPARRTGRIVALPGERATVEESVDVKNVVPFFRTMLTVDSKEVEQTCEPAESEGGASGEGDAGKPNPARRLMPGARLCMENAGDGRAYRIRETVVPGSGNAKISDLRLGPDEYFILSDDRDIGADSRFFGPVAADLIHEKYLYTAFSLAYSPPSDEKDAPGGSCGSQPFRAVCILQNAALYDLRTDRVGRRMP